MYPPATPLKTLETKQLTLKQMKRTQQIKDAHPWLSYDEVVKIILYHYHCSMWVQNLERI